MLDPKFLMGNSSSGMGIGPLILPRMFEGGVWSDRPRPALDELLNRPIVFRSRTNLALTWQGAYTTGKGNRIVEEKRCMCSTSSRPSWFSAMAYMICMPSIILYSGNSERILSSSPLQPASLAMRVNNMRPSSCESKGRKGLLCSRYTAATRRQAEKVWGPSLYKKAPESQGADIRAPAPTPRASCNGILRQLCRGVHRVESRSSRGSNAGPGPRIHLVRLSSGFYETSESSSRWPEMDYPRHEQGVRSDDGGPDKGDRSSISGYSGHPGRPGWRLVLQTLLGPA
jgi:hypothetical protein